MGPVRQEHTQEVNHGENELDDRDHSFAGFVLSANGIRSHAPNTTGVIHVWENGQQVLKDGEHTRGDAWGGCAWAGD